LVVLDAAIHESLAQKAACPLESVDASYPNKVGAGNQPEPELSPEFERQTYSEKRKFWEDISRKRESYQRSESEVSRASQLTINESDSESCPPNIVSEEGDGTTEGISEVMRSETFEDINVPDISECSVAEKAHYFEEQIQKEMAKGTPRVHQQDAAKSEKDKPLSKGKSIDEHKKDSEAIKEKIDVEEKHVAESRGIEKMSRDTEDIKRIGETRKEPKDDKREKDAHEGKGVREEIQKIVAQPVTKICKELLNKEREFVEETHARYAKMEETVSKEIEIKKMDKPARKEEREEIVAQEKLDIPEVQEIAEEEKPDTPSSKEISKEKSSGRKIITEETTIIYKVQKDGSLVQEQVLKSIQIEGANGQSVTQMPEVSVETKKSEKDLLDTEMQSDEKLRAEIKSEPISSDIKKKIERFLEEEKQTIDEVTKEKKRIEKEEDKDSKGALSSEEDTSELLQKVEEMIAKQAIDTSFDKKKVAMETEMKQAKKEYESRIPISTAMAEKDKSQKEIKTKLSPEKLDEKSIKSPIEERKDVTSPSSKKKEFESRIPKRILEGTAIKEKDARKDLPGRKDQAETITVTEKKSSEEMTSRREEHLTTKSKTQTFSKMFVDAQDAFKMFEDDAMKNKDFATITSKVDTRASSKVEKKEVTSSEISTGADKFITHEEKEKVERKKSSESKLTKESPVETIQEKKSKSEEVDKTAMQKMSMNVTEGKEVIDASASKSRAENKKEELFKSHEDKEGIATEKSGVSKVRESDVDVAIRIKKDDTKKVEDIEASKMAAEESDLGKVEMIAQGQSYKESTDSFKIEQFTPSQKEQSKTDLSSKPKKDEQSSSAKALGESLEEKYQSASKEIEARNVAEDLIQSIESEIEKRSSLSGLKLNKQYLDQLISESSDTDHEKLADDLTKKFENIMKKSSEEQLMESKADQAIAAPLKTFVQEESFEKGSTRDSMSISEDITKDEESSHEREESLQSSSQARFQDRDITMSPSSISEQIDLEETIDVDTGELEDISKPTSSPQSDKLRSDRSSSHIEALQRDVYSSTSLSKDKMLSEISGARVLEILEPGAYSRQDSVDVPSLELDEHKVSEPTSKDVASLHESTAVDSLERIIRERDVTISASTEDVNAESLVYEHTPNATLPSDGKVTRDSDDKRRADSFEIESPPLVSPRTKHVHDLEIKPVNWMIGDEKIEISETLEPSQVFSQELEAYELSIQRTRTSSQDESVDLEQESATKSSEEISVIESGKEPVADVASAAPRTTKFTVIPVIEPVTEMDLDSELIEDKLDITCQELVDTLQREYDAKTPTDEYAVSIRQSIPREDFDLEASITEAVTEMIPAKEEEAKDWTEIEPAEIVPSVRVTDEQIPQDISAVQAKVLELDVVNKISATKIEKEEAKHVIEEEELQKGIESMDKTIDESEVAKEGAKEAAKAKTKKAVETQKEETEVPKCARVDDALKEWTETYLVKIKPPSEEYKRHVEKTTEKHDRSSKSTAASSDTCALKIKKDELQGVDLSARYAITVLDQVVKKEIAEVKESLEAAKQDLIEELSENSQTVIQIKDSPSEFQFKLQPESIPNDLPFLYRPPSIEQIPAEVETEAETKAIPRSESPVTRTRELEETPREEMKGSIDDKSIVEMAAVIEDEPAAEPASEIDIEKHEQEPTIITVDERREDEEEEDRPSPLPISRSSDIGSDFDNRDDSYSLAPPQPAPRRRQKPARISKKVKSSESEAEVGSSSESSNYQSCDYELGSGSRPSSSDVEALQSAAGGVQSGTVSEYETAMMSMEHEGSRTLPTSQEYQTAASTLSSRESMKSLNSLSSGHLGSIDSTSELSETLVPSEEADEDKDEIDENLESALDAEQEIGEVSDSSGSEEIPMDETVDKIDSHIPCRMKRSSEMIFQQIMDDNVSLETKSMNEMLEEDQAKVADMVTSAYERPDDDPSMGTMTSRVFDDGVQSVCTQAMSTRVTRPSDSEEPEETVSSKTEKDTRKDAQTTDVEMTEQKSELETSDENLEPAMCTSSVHSILQQASVSLSSASGISFETVIEKDTEKDKSDRHSPDSDSFELVDKPDIIDDFVVIEEVGREAEEFDSEGKSIRISSMPQVTSKQFDRDLENMIAEKKENAQESTSQTRNSELFDFESEESPPQASNDSQSYSDEEQYEGKKWIEMQFHTDARGVYDIEYDRAPLEDIKEEEVTDFEAGSSRFGSLGSHKESIGSVGSMRGSFGSTPDYDVLGKRYFSKPTDHDTLSLTSLQEFEHLENTVASENSRRVQCGSQDSSNNGSLPRRYVTSRSGHGDDVSLSSLKDFEGLERACREAHLMELRAREEEELLEHESPENKYKMEGLSRTKPETSSTTGSFNPSTSGSDDYEKRIKEIDEIIRIAQSNVEKFDRQDDTTEDISQIEGTDIERMVAQPVPETLPEETEMPPDEAQAIQDTNVMQTSTDSLELEDNNEKKYHPLCRSSDSLEMKTTLDFPSLSSDSLNNMRDTKETVQQSGGSARRISSDSLDMPLLEQQDAGASEKSSDSNGRHEEEMAIVGRTSSTATSVRNGKTKASPST